MASSPRLSAAFVVLCCAATAPAWSQGAAAAADRVFEGTLKFSPDEEARYLKRYQLSRSRGVAEELYEPREAIRGARAPDPLPIARAHERSVSRKSLAEATAYAARNNSSAFIVWRNGKVESETYFGEATRNTALNSFSLAKPITAVAVGRAILLGRIRSLDQPVADFVAEWRDDALRSRILVRHLLDMRTGFLRQGDGASPDDIMARSFLHPRSDEILMREYPVVDRPGTRYEYNNAASDMVAILIERATGRRYAEFVGTEILQKIGAPGGSVWVNREGGVAHAGCCMLLPAEVFLRLAILILRDGVWNGQRLLPESYVADMKRSTAENPHYGLGLYVAGPYTARRGAANPDLPVRQTLHGEPYLAADLYLFDGNMNQVVYVIPSQDLVILRTGRAPPRSAGSEWDNSYLPNLILRGIVRDKRSSVAQAP
jgi:CubicO group peptidase (beta-lactamase class C family)